MSFKKYIGTVAFVSLLALLAPSVDACSCMESHPQTHFCHADYIIIMRVVRESRRLLQDHKVYKIEIKKSYKMTEEAQNILKHGRISTPISDSMCGVSLEVGKLYVVAGRGSKLSLCHYIKEYQKMSIVERRGFAGAYRKGCKCKVKTCFNGCMAQSAHSCSWSPFKKCERDYSLCVPTVYNTPEGPISQCNWKKTLPYKACLADP